MTEAIAFSSLEFGARHNESGCGIAFFGGEPLLCRSLIHSTVRRAREMTRAGCIPYYFKITTNGLLLDQAFIDYAAENQIVVAVSIDGTQEVHDRHRRLPVGAPTYERVRQNLERLLEAKPYSNVIMVVNPDTVDKLADSVSCLVEMGCRYVIMSLNYAAAWSEEALVTLETQYEDLARRYVSWTRQGRKFYFSPFETKIASHVDTARYCRHRCALGQRQISVDPEGYLFACVQFPRATRHSDFCLGHVQSGFDDSRLERIVALGAVEDPACVRCALKSRCNHTCSCLNWQATGTITEVSPVLCRHERFLMRLVDDVGAQLYAEKNPLFLQKHYNPSYPLLSLLEDQQEG